MLLISLVGNVTSVVDIDVEVVRANVVRSSVVVMGT